MPELGKYGSVRGALSNGCLYRDWVVNCSDYPLTHPTNANSYKMVRMDQIKTGKTSQFSFWRRHFEPRLSAVR